MTDEKECTCGSHQQFGRFCRKCGGLKNSSKPDMSSSCVARHGQVESGEHCIDCGQRQ